MRATGIAVGISLIAHIHLFAQTENPHERDFERAHPTPVKQSDATQKIPMIPMMQSVPFPGLFLNVNTIIEEDDPLPVQNESAIAVNPTNPLNLIASAVDYRDGSSTWVYHSTDGGLTWQNTNLGKVKSGWASSNDPSVSFDHEGRGFLCYGGFNRVGNSQFGENGVFVSVTTDAGSTWNPKHVPVIIHTGQQTADSAFEDKYYVHADTSSTSPYRGRLYIPWKRIINTDTSTQIVISFSTDRGLTWSVPTNVSDRFANSSNDPTFGQSFPLARTAPNGNVHVVWNSGTESAIRYARSSDGGTSWTQPAIIHTYRSFGEKIEIGKQVNSRVKGVVRAEAYPTLVIDNTGGLRNGWMYLCWAADNYPNVYFSRSTDNGTSWSSPRIVHSDTTNDQFWPWIALDPTNGDIAVTYFDSRDDSENILVNSYVSYSSDGGSNWIDRRVGDGINDLRKNPFEGNTFAGDYSGCDFYRGRIYPSWVDMRNVSPSNRSDNDVFTSVISVDAPEPPREFTASTLADEPTSILLEWSPISQRSFGQTLDAANTFFIIYRDGDSVFRAPISVLSWKDTGLVRYSEYQYKLVAASGTSVSSPRFASAFAGGSRQPGIPTIMSSSGSKSDSVSVLLSLPTTRLDGVTKLVNLDTIRIRANSVVFDFDVEPSDTGKTMAFNLYVGERGWYRISAATIDDESTSSPFSDTTVVYAGSLANYFENFSTKPRYLVQTGSWDTTDNFYFSEPASYTDSPVGPYARSSKDTVYLYPFSEPFPSMEGNDVILSWRVAAFIDPGDTMFLETKTGYGFDGKWSVLAWWNSSLDDRWTDTTKSDDAWRFGDARISGRELVLDTLMFRLRFKSNVTKQSDGFYFDDFSIEQLTSVEDQVEAVHVVYPQPASSHVMIGLEQGIQINDCNLIDIHGTSHPVNWYQSGQSLLVNLTQVPIGSYALTMQTGRTNLRERITVIR